MLASEAAYAASLLEGDRGQDVIAAAAEHSDAAVRVPAAAAARNLPASDASDVLQTLIEDHDPGVRKVARAGPPGEPSAALAERLWAASEAEAHGGTTAPQPLHPAAIDAPMSGESTVARSRPMTGEQTDGGLMPGEARPGHARAATGLMPGEQSAGGLSPQPHWS